MKTGPFNHRSRRGTRRLPPFFKVLRAMGKKRAMVNAWPVVSALSLGYAIL